MSETEVFGLSIALDGLKPGDLVAAVTALGARCQADPDATLAVSIEDGRLIVDATCREGTYDAYQARYQAMIADLHAKLEDLHAKLESAA